MSVMISLNLRSWDSVIEFCPPEVMQVGKDKELGFDPCCIAFHDNKYLCVGGSDKKVISVLIALENQLRPQTQRMPRLSEDFGGTSQHCSENECMYLLLVI